MGRATVHPARPVHLGAVVAAFADGLRRRGPMAGPLALSDVQTPAEVEGAMVRFRDQWASGTGDAVRGNP